MYKYTYTYTRMYTRFILICVFSISISYLSFIYINTINTKLTVLMPGQTCWNTFFFYLANFHHKQRFFYTFIQ